MLSLHPAIWAGIMTTALVLFSQHIHSSLVSSKHPSLQPPWLSQFLLCSHTSNQNVPGNRASVWRGDASAPGQMHLISQSGRLSSAPPTRMWMLASTGRDKCGQSQAITRRAEEASELMTGRERSGGILSARRSSGSGGDKCFPRRLRWKLTAPTTPSPSCSLLYQAHPRVPLITSPSAFTTTSQYKLTLMQDELYDKHKHGWSGDEEQHILPLF